MLTSIFATFFTVLLVVVLTLLLCFIIGSLWTYTELIEQHSMSYVNMVLVVALFLTISAFHIMIAASNLIGG